MPQETKAHGSERPLWEGRSFRPENQAELFELIEAAFDYRGDVTLELKDGSTLEGYVFHREPKGAEPYIQIFPKGESDSKIIQYWDIVAIAFTGEDTAFGKSWEAWIAKSESLRKAEADKVMVEAKTRGDL
jgi:hypothetical protein